MRHSGKISAKALKLAIESAKPGISLVDLDSLIEAEIKDKGGEISFKTVPGYKWASCLTLNHEVVHGIPRDIVLQKGDILGMDLGTVYKGWHTDCAWSVVVGKEPNHFLKIGEQALWAGIDQALEGNRVGDIGQTIQDIVEGAGYAIVRSLVGHGIGRELHEQPEVPGFGKRGTGHHLKEGMALAIEVIYTSGRHEVEVASDGWTIVSSDRSSGGLFEMTVVVGKNKPEVLTDWRYL